jgi:hypothetical protein
MADSSQPWKMKVIRASTNMWKGTEVIMVMEENMTTGLGLGSTDLIGVSLVLLIGLQT